MRKQLLTVLACSLLFFFACNKTTNDQTDQQTNVIDGNKQLAKIDFNNTSLEMQSEVTKNTTGLSGKTGSTFTTAAWALNAFELDAPFISVYGMFNGKMIVPENLSIQLSGSADGKNWSSWQEVHVNADAETSTDRFLFNNIELDKQTKFVKLKADFKNVGATIENASIYFFNPQNTSAALQAEIDEAARLVTDEVARLNNPDPNARAANPALCTKPNFQLRTTWGARAPKSSPAYTTVNFLCVHHEEGSNSSTDWAARVRAVQNFHMDGNGWADIGYNYLVDPNGVAYEGRGGGENVIGAHLCGKNTNTMGICMLGSFTSVRPTNNAEYTLKRILAWKAKQRGLDVLGTGYHVDRTIYRISGHRSSCSTDCPGTALFNDLPRLRTDIQNNFINQCN